MQARPDGSSCLLFALAFAFVLVEKTRLHAHDDLAQRMLAGGDASRAEWFEMLRTPSGGSCCSLSDCRDHEPSGAATRGVGGPS